MYSIKNDKDIPYILKYHRANDMVYLKKFFPDLSPIDDLYVVLNEDDYIKNEKILVNMTQVRNGNPIKEPCMKSIPTDEYNPDFLSIMKSVKKENEDGVLILFNLSVKNTLRYEKEAGISVGVSLGNNVYIDAVGKGFDGREVLKGISCHERYNIPWTDLRIINISNFKDYRTYLVDNKEYTKSRKERIEYLISCGIDKEVLEKNIPIKYNEIDDYIWIDIIKNILKVLDKEEEILKGYGFLEFNLSGHTEGKRFRPWQMVNDKRM